MLESVQEEALLYIQILVWVQMEQLTKPKLCIHVCYSYFMFYFCPHATVTDTANPDDPNEISFTKGESLEIIDKQGKWWQAKKTDGSVGSMCLVATISTYQVLTLVSSRQSRHRITSKSSDHRRQDMLSTSNTILSTLIFSGAFSDIHTLMNPNPFQSFLTPLLSSIYLIYSAFRSYIIECIPGCPSYSYIRLLGLMWFCRELQRVVSSLYILALHLCYSFSSLLEPLQRTVLSSGTYLYRHSQPAWPVCDG